MENASKEKDTTIIQKDWTELQHFQLFNKLNNLVSQLILDFKPQDQFNALHIKESHCIPTNNTLDADIIVNFIKKALASRHEQTLYVEIVVLLPDHVEAETLLEMITELITEDEAVFINESDSRDSDAIKDKQQRKYCCSLFYVLNSDEFFKSYARCSFFMIKENVPRSISGTTNTYANEILANFLFLGDCSNAIDIEQHRALGITHIVEATHSRFSQHIAKNNDIQYLEIKIWDYEGASISDHFNRVHGFIEFARSTGGKVFVHCKAGISRSSSLILSYLLKYHDMTLRDAIKFVVTARPIVCPNDGFMSQLIVYEASLRGENSIIDLDSFKEVVNEYANLWCKVDSLDCAYEKISIDSWKQLKAQQMQELDEEYNNNDIDASKQRVTKPPQPFLKRGEGNKKSAPVTKPSETLSDKKKSSNKARLSDFVNNLRMECKHTKSAIEVEILEAGQHNDKNNQLNNN